MSASNIPSSNRRTRRQFLKTASLALAGAALPLHRCSHLISPTLPPPGLQLWSLREDMARNPQATVKAVAELGYRTVEGYGFENGRIYNLPLSDFVKMLRDAGLSMTSVHRSFAVKDYDPVGKSLTYDARQDLDLAAAAGLQYLVWAWVNDHYRADFPLLMQACGTIGKQAERAGLHFAYHNHDYEFALRGPDQRLMLEWLLTEVDPAAMDFEMDLYWVAYAGQQPLDWIRRYPGRWKLCHVKDLARNEQRETAPVGDGLIDFSAIFREREKAGFQQYFIELEHYQNTPLEDVARSRQGYLNLKI